MMRIIFMGTPDFAVPALSAVLAAGHEVVARLYAAAARGRSRARRPEIAGPALRREQGARRAHAGKPQKR